MRYNLFKQKFAKTVLIAMLALAVTAAPAAHYFSQTVSAASLSELQEKQQEIQKEQQETSKKLQQLKEDKEKQQEYKDTLDQQLYNIKQETYVIQAHINELDAKINEQQAAMADKQAEIDDNLDQLGQRLRAIYLGGEVSTLEILLQSQNATDLMTNMEVMQSITEHDKKLINTLQESMSQIKQEKEAIEADRAEVAAAKEQLDKKQAEINELVAESERVLAEINANISEANEHMHSLDEQSAEAAAAVDQWFRDYYANKAWQDEIRDTLNNGGNGSGTIINGGVNSQGWMFPAPGTHGLTSDFRDGRNHGAWDIATGGCYGNPIVAARAGVVIQVNSDSWGGGYGTYAFVDHGDGYVTVYAHMSNRIVSTGQYVAQGQVLGYIGSTGQSTGPHLHFEIRLNGVKQDPYYYYTEIYNSLIKYY